MIRLTAFVSILAAVFGSDVAVAQVEEDQGWRYRIPLHLKPDDTLATQTAQLGAINELRCRGISEGKARAMFLKQYGKRLERVRKDISERSRWGPYLASTENILGWCAQFNGAEQRFADQLRELESRAKARRKQ